MKQLPENTVKHLYEGVFIILLAMSVLTLLALFSFHPQDPAWSYVGSHEGISNLGGKFGAWYADIFLYGFGYLAYLFPLLSIYLAYLLLLRRNHVSFDYRVLLVRVFGLILILIGACSLIDLDLLQFKSPLPFSAGGLVGTVVASSLNATFNPQGALIFSFALLLTGITFFIGLSWLLLLELIGKASLLAVKKLFGFVIFSGIALKKTWQSLRVKRQQKAAMRSVTLQAKRSEKMIAKAKQHKPKIVAPAASLTTSKRYEKERQTPLFNTLAAGSLPPLTLLDPTERSTGKSINQVQLEALSRAVEQCLLDFGVTVHVTAVNPGPVVTRFELQLAPGLKVSKISGLAKDIARSLSVISVRVVEVIAGKSVIGLELPNEHREMVRLCDVLATEQYDQARSPLSLALGVDIAGHPVIVDLAKMPHLLVAGTTGSGKSVGLNAMLLSLLFKASPQEVRLIMVDPKMLELSVYEGIPHLLTPVVTDMKEAANALRWAVAEMERRYRLMAALKVRNIGGYNNKIEAAKKQGEPITDPLWKSELNEEPAPELECLPYIVIVIDELADMMMVVGKKVEQLIARTAQKARAAGIHMILATQRPSVDVLTGLIKSNIPTRIAFQVSSKIDSRTILDQMGAEQLLGHGDMLYLVPGTGMPMRVHGAFVDDHEVHKVVAEWKRYGEPVYMEDVLAEADEQVDIGFSEASEDQENDPLYDEAIYIVTKSRKVSISSLQRRFKIGYNRAARLVEDMEKAGVVSEMETNGGREVLAPPPPE
ncbi:MAG: DNA translocase FtsK 4TM domain-containing protein, partial [Gammaproteobacteria bacterium]